MVKTIEYSAGVTPVDFSQAIPYGGSNRYYAVMNYGKKDIFISNKNDAAQGADGSKRVPAGECRGIDMQGLNVLYIAAQSAGAAEIDTAAGISALGFRSAAKGGDDTVSEEGNPVQIDGLQGGVPFNRVEVGGKNLLTYPYFDTTKTVNGVTFTDNGDGTITINGTSTGNSNFNFINADTDAIYPAGTYTISGMPANSTIDLRVYNVDDAIIISRDYGNGAKFELENPTKLRIYLYFGAGFTFDNFVVKPQLELGDTATEYEPPITGRELQVNVCGKNLLNNKQASAVSAGITITKNSDGTVTLNGTSTADFWLLFATKCPIIKGKTYTFSSGLNYDSSLIFAVRSEDGTDSYLSTRTYERFVSPITGLCRIRAFAEKNSIFDNLIIRPQLELGSTATPYEPYHGATYTITPDSNPYTLPVDITQYDGINVLSIADDSNPIISVSGNKASEQLNTIYRTLDNKPVLLFDGDIPTSSGTYAEFTINKDYTALIIAPLCNRYGEVYDMGACVVLPIGYATEAERGFSALGYPGSTSIYAAIYIKRSGNTFYVYSRSTNCDHLTIYGV